MNREIKFRFWLGHIGKMTYAHSLQEVGKIIPEFTEDIIPMQYTGLTDKRGIEIYEGDCDSLGNVVEFVNGTWCLNGDRPLYAFNFEIARNIYQHKNLLATGKG